MQHGTALSNDVLVTAAPAAAHYIPDFITVEEEEYLLRKIDESPKLNWKPLGNRRLQLWGGEILQKNVLFRKAMPPFLTSYPNVIGRLKETQAFAFSPHKQPNHIILNEYLPGQGIMPHEDGPLYYPVVGTVSLGSHSVFHYYAYNSDRTPDHVAHTSSGRTIYPKPVLSVFLEPRSVIITSGDLYTSHLHGIDEVTHDVFLGDGRLLCPTGDEVVLSNWRTVRTQNMADVLRYGGTLPRETRLSLTCRDVEKVATPMRGHLPALNQVRLV
ncbi:hypothetical protein L210DRAFT_3541486 [Boletus edulis BED1]|uniref:Fe2OG dioxygenase domain-containing protein n=1 Tax=Boletus edulis BED1 TaxID=1328754 RepID=A0AAD4BUX2_BOLED|nr:hypothetical protein L210DRAFT_3541486 [Boletus edulis BED1]